MTLQRDSARTLPEIAPPAQRPQIPLAVAVAVACAGLAVVFGAYAIAE
jgi:hypothetical protein